MVIGNGLMARAFSEMQDMEGICIFASGVSDSEGDNSAGFKREQDLLESTIKSSPDSLFVYFSTCSVDDSSVADRPYCKHKLHMESLIQQQASRYLICRLSHIVGEGGNQKTIVNYLVDKVKRGHDFDLWVDAERNLLDVEDVVVVVKSLITAQVQNKVVNIASPVSHTTLQLVQTIENYLERKASYRSVHKGQPLLIDCPEMNQHFAELDRIASPDYLSQLLEKYHHASV